jgi:flagellar assembly protein FliH
MKLLFNVIKPGELVCLNEYVLIPDSHPDGGSSHACQKPQEQAAKNLQSVPDPKSVEQHALQKAQAQARGILERARAQKEQILARAQTQAQTLEQQARAEGYQQGFREGAQEKGEQIEQAIGDVRALLAQLEQGCTRLLEEYAAQVGTLAVDVASKVLSKRIAQDELEMAGLVKTALYSVRGADWISLELSDALPKLVFMLERELAGKGGSGSVKILTKEMPEDSCIIQTSEGIINASVSTQLKNLRELFGRLDTGGKNP